jgi:hypothetical protein
MAQHRLCGRFQGHRECRDFETQKLYIVNIHEFLTHCSTSRVSLSASG